MMRTLRGTLPEVLALLPAAGYTWRAARDLPWPTSYRSTLNGALAALREYGLATRSVHRLCFATPVARRSSVAYGWRRTVTGDAWLAEREASR